jgi:hypothetical protein
MQRILPGQVSSAIRWTIFGNPIQSFTGWRSANTPDAKFLKSLAASPWLGTRNMADYDEWRLKTGFSRQERAQLARYLMRILIAVAAWAALGWVHAS